MMYREKELRLFLVVVAATAAAALPIAEDDVIIAITNGKIQGRSDVTIKDHRPYYAFQGIPYAQPPLQDLRFNAPLPPDNWQGILDARKDKKVCMQLQANMMHVNEDCLYINVYTPSLHETKLPVMVWIYGGGFFLGGSTYDQYGPDYFLEHNVIVVTFNYRIGIFGFLSTEDQVAPGNAGLKDQILALKWVQENIAHFGGDPSNVTLFGQSAGAASVSYLMQTPQTKGFFQRAILESGSSLNLWALARNKRQSSFATGRLLGINASDAQALIEGLRKIDAFAIMLASLATDVVLMGFSNPLDGLLFSPTIEPDGTEDAVITRNSYMSLENGDFHRIPTIVGFTSLEGLAFDEAIHLIRVYLTTYTTNICRYAPVDLNIANETVKGDVGKKIADWYNIEHVLQAQDADILKFLSDDQFVRPLNKLAQLQSRYAPVFLYRYTYSANLTKDHHVPGIAHGEEVDLMWTGNGRDLTTDRDRLTSERLIKLWTNFAKTSNPTPTADDIVLQNIVWPHVTRQQQRFLDIGDDLVVGLDPESETVTFWEELYEEYGMPPYDTY